ncbi:type VII secretion-associated serine protease mycosin [Micromonospora craterilacus]|uniref:Type VII secretion-associated serine protease mycosin n=1 Tax=Micromonospora craterilacus TaxID=1655439 RepID=A0A2W2EEP3_9ACTN|nr:type VII secretion-associated serine protease mycosin [Micromonospora craterilacus]
MLLGALPPVRAATETAPALDDASRVRRDQWHLPFLRTVEAHRISQGEGVTVAVVDTGVEPHPDLERNLLPGIDLLEIDSKDGRKDSSGHGTGMAGIIAAHGQANGTGALGIAPKAQIIPIRCFDGSSDGEIDCLATAIEYAITSGADIVSISAGGGPSARLSRALDGARSANVVVVAAAGNRADDPGVPYPAAANAVIAVGGIDNKGQHAAISVASPAVDVVAPAIDIYSTSIKGKYRRGTGTSGATAIVAGAAALIRAKYPYLPADEVAHRLTATAIDKGPPGRDDQYGYGVIDLVAALTADVPPRGFESVPATSPEVAGPTTAADGPLDDGDGAATVRGLVTLGVLLAAGGAWTLFVRHRRRSDDPPPRITR